MADSPYRREGVPRAANPDPHAGYRRQAEHRFGTPPGQLGAQARQAPPPGGGTRGDQAAVMRSRMLLTAAGVLAIGAVLHLMKFVFAAAFGS
ncbi:MAG: hypothetical protein U1D00_33575, partial [Mycobacterium sp.]|nr:hypothetical protein [Mycobacterium sp.]